MTNFEPKNLKTIIEILKYRESSIIQNLRIFIDSGSKRYFLNLLLIFLRSRFKKFASCCEFFELKESTPLTNMSKYICEHCDKIFATKSNLKNHAKTAKYCLEIQGMKIDQQLFCEFCNHQFMQKYNYQRHLETCELRKNKTRSDEILKLTQELDQKNQDVNKYLTLETSLKHALDKKSNKIVNLKKDLLLAQTENIKLKEDLAFERGQIEGFQKTKPPTINNQYIHPKLKNVPIANILPLDDSVEAYLYKYDYNTFLTATKGAVKVLLDIVIFEDENGIINRNCVCTNRARNSFHILVHDKIWTKDNGAACIHTYLDLLKPLVNTHYATFNDVMNDLITNGDALDMQLIRKRHNKLTPFRNGILGKPGMEAREKLLVDVRAGIRDQTSI